MPKFVQVWGKEPGEEESAMLYAFPEVQWTEEFARQVLAHLEARGVTDVEVRREGPTGDPIMDGDPEAPKPMGVIRAEESK